MRVAILLMILLWPVPTFAQSFADDKCRHLGIFVENALGMREQGVPFEIAERSAVGGFPDPIDQEIMRISVQSAYQNPGGVYEALRSGYWHQLCVQAQLGQ